MSLYKRGAIWWSYFYVGGLRHQHSTGAVTLFQAKQIERKLIADANARRHQLVEFDLDLTVSELARRFIAATRPRPYTLGRLQMFLPFFGSRRAACINRAMTREYRCRRLAGGSIKHATINRDLSVLRRLLYWAVEEGLLPSCPLARLRLERERRTHRLVLRLAEETKLEEAAADHLRPVIIAALDTGMRRGEILNQRWEDIDLARRVLWVTRSKTPEGESREIPLTTRLFELLSKRPQSDGPVFLYKGRPLKTVARAWAAAIRRAGIRYIRFHDLRHSFATRLMEAGVMQEVRKALMGHSSGDRVHSIYTHVELPIKRDAIARLEEWMHFQQGHLDDGRSFAGMDTSRSAPSAWSRDVGPGSERISNERFPREVTPHCDVARCRAALD